MARNSAEGKTRDVVASEGTPAAGSISLAQQPAAQKWNYGARSHRESILEALIEVLGSESGVGEGSQLSSRRFRVSLPPWFSFPTLFLA